VGLGGFEPPTSPLSGVRSNHLSYRPGIVKRPCSSKLPCCRSRLDSQSSRHVADSFLQPNSLDQVTCAGTHAADWDAFSLKEVIQPQVPLGLPCYDFTPVMNHKVVSALPKVKLPTSFATHSHGVTGGVYKARERIHRGILIRDY
jgi:hypothetical protein